MVVARGCTHIATGVYVALCALNQHVIIFPKARCASYKPRDKSEI